LRVCWSRNARARAAVLRFRFVKSRFSSQKMYNISNTEHSSKLAKTCSVARYAALQAIYAFMLSTVPFAAGLPTSLCLHKPMHARAVTNRCVVPLLQQRRGSSGTDH
jgi:hypothetical protein